MNDAVLILTLNDCPGRAIVRVIGPVYGTSVRSRTIVGNFLGGVRAIFGGKQSGFTQLINENRDDALAALAEHAQSLGANAVLGMRFDSGEFDSGQGQAMNEITAYGTAVVLAPASA
ncbi:MAG: YbjQ family protein [Acidithiobacillus sp.]|uniref:YbjQ family protein n=1 Tax=Acidithiobacillus sp. TaxID=1872118 RepID=UPI003D0189CE